MYSYTISHIVSSQHKSRYHFCLSIRHTANIWICLPDVMRDVECGGSKCVDVCVWLFVCAQHARWKAISFSTANYVIHSAYACIHCMGHIDGLRIIIDIAYIDSFTLTAHNLLWHSWHFLSICCVLLLFLPHNKCSHCTFARYSYSLRNCFWKLTVFCLIRLLALHGYCHCLFRLCWCVVVALFILADQRLLQKPMSNCDSLGKSAILVVWAVGVGYNQNLISWKTRFWHIEIEYVGCMIFPYIYPTVRKLTIRKSNISFDCI